MRRALLCPVLLVVQLFLPGVAEAAARALCVDPPARKWCFGAVAIDVDDTHAEAAMFANDDILVAVTEKGRTERMLKRADAKTEVYFGLADEERASGTVGFKFSLEGFAWMVAPLAIAFPDGPSSVPATPVEKRIDMPGYHLTMLIWRLPDERIAFRLLPHEGKPSKKISGEFHGGRPQALEPSVVESWGPAMQSSPVVRLKPPAAAPAAPHAAPPASPPAS